VAKRIHAATVRAACETRKPKPTGKTNNASHPDRSAAEWRDLTDNAKREIAISASGNS
jgi:hypothetical protein